jgi:hypothetical protein
VVCTGNKSFGRGATPAFKVKRYSLKDRKSKVELSLQGVPHAAGGLFSAFIAGLPKTLAADDLRTAARNIVGARRADRPVILGMGAHPIKVGLSPIIIDLMERGIITALCTNGASAVHDFEMALAGFTSEDVACSLDDGSFGMAKETGVMLNGAISEGVQRGLGLGRAVGEFIHNDRKFRHKAVSIFAAAYRLGLPLTVHVAIGTDIIHMHPEADGAAIGEGSLRDFKILTGQVAGLEGGVFINLGSAVIIPEVFLKAINLARNTGSTVDKFTALNMDFIRHYRAHENVLRRPTKKGGTALGIVGHHEIMLPLLAAAVIESAAMEGV